MVGEGEGGEGGRCLGCGEVAVTLENEDGLIADRGVDWDDDGDIKKGSVRDRTSIRFVMDLLGEWIEWGFNCGRGAKISERSFGL